MIEICIFMNILELVDGKSFNLQYRIIHKNGGIVWVQDKTLPVLDAEGRLIRIDGIVSNISDQKEYEKKIKHLAYHDQFNGLTKSQIFLSVKLNHLLK